MRFTILVVAAALALASACSSDSVLIETADDLAIYADQVATTELDVAKRGVKMVPVEGIWNFALDPTADPVPCFVPDNPDPVAFFPSGRMLGTGIVSHLGKTNSVIDIDGCSVNPVNGSLSGSGSAVHTGANGDALFASYVAVVFPDGTLFFDPALADPPIVFAGGTGRFDGATGWGHGGGALDTMTGIGSFWIKGMVSSVGSAK